MNKKGRIGSSFSDWLDEEGIREDVDWEARKALRYKFQPWYVKLWRWRCYLAWPFIFLWNYILDPRNKRCKSDGVITRAMFAKIMAGAYLSDVLYNWVTKEEIIENLERGNPGFKWPYAVWPKPNSAPLPGVTPEELKKQPIRFEELRLPKLKSWPDIKKERADRIGSAPLPNSDPKKIMEEMIGDVNKLPNPPKKGKK